MTEQLKSNTHVWQANGTWLFEAREDGKVVSVGSGYATADDALAAATRAVNEAKRPKRITAQDFVNQQEYYKGVIRTKKAIVTYAHKSIVDVCRRTDNSLNIWYQWYSDEYAIVPPNTALGVEWLDADLAAMAADPDIRRDMHDIAAKFEDTPGDTARIWRMVAALERENAALKSTIENLSRLADDVWVAVRPEGDTNEYDYPAQVTRWVEQRMNELKQERAKVEALENAIWKIISIGNEPLTGSDVDLQNAQIAIESRKMQKAATDAMDAIEELKNNK